MIESAATVAGPAPAQGHGRPGFCHPSSGHPRPWAARSGPQVGLGELTTILFFKKIIKSSYFRQFKLFFLF